MYFINFNPMRERGTKHQSLQIPRSRFALQLVSLRSRPLVWFVVAMVVASMSLTSSSPIAVAQSATNRAKPKYKRLPPAGIEVSAEVRAVLKDRLNSVSESLETAAASAKDSAEWRVEVEVLIRAVRLALDQNLFFKKSHVSAAGDLLDEADRRINAATKGARGLQLLGFDPTRNDEPQPLVGGFVSRIDDSVQPYGLVLPAGFTLDQAKSPMRMDVFLHGRGDTKTEIPFLVERSSKIGLYSPANTVVLHPFGRHCNAFKFAGETDVYEAIENAAKLIAIDKRRVSIRGFSMGGAGCWHMTVHDPTRWLASNPGAGFVDTLVYQGWKDSPPFELTDPAVKLLHWYDVLPWARNLYGTNVVAYSGEVDKQKQAADRVVQRASELGISFPYVIGAKMGHKVDDASKSIIDQQIAEWSEDVSDGPAKNIEFVTYTLRYHTADWLRVAGMKEHWKPASVSATLDPSSERIEIETSDVTHLDIDFFETGWPGRKGPVDIDIDGERYSIEDNGNRPGFQCSLVKDDRGRWTPADRDRSDGSQTAGNAGTDR